MSLITWVKSCPFLKNYVTSNGAVSCNVLYYQINSSPLLVIKSVFMLTIALGNYHSVQWILKSYFPCFFFFFDS